jgi:23S rRNA pseudouridine2604 synthase
VPSQLVFEKWEKVHMSDSKESIRLSKHLSQKGVCSRREADSLIEQGLILVNGVPAKLGQKVTDSDSIEVLKGGTRKLDSKVSLILHKPVGFVSGQAEDGYKPATTLITKPNQYDKDTLAFSKKLFEGLAPAGRLDIDSRGLLLLTQDGVVAKSVIGPESKMEKEYVIKVKGDLEEGCLSKLSFGLKLDGVDLKPAKVRVIRDQLLNIVLVEGKKRQIRRMCEAVGLEVLMLKRVRIGPIRLSDLPEGQWRHLSPREIDELRNFERKI